MANPRVDRVGSRCGRGIACSARYTPQPRVRGRGANFFFSVANTVRFWGSVTTASSGRAGTMEGTGSASLPVWATTI